MTFPGESIVLDWANPLTGGPYENIRYRAGADTLTSGDAFIAGFYQWRTLESETDAVAASIVLVFEAGTAGTVTVSVGTDPTFELDNPTLATQSLGSHAVTSATELVLPVTVFDLPAFYNGDSEFIAHVQCTDGTLALAQIKLRLWPPGGPRGAWAVGPPFVVEFEPETFSAGDTASGLEVNTSLESAHALAVDDWVSDDEWPVALGSRSTAANGAATLADGPSSDTYAITVGIGYLFIGSTANGNSVTTAPLAHYAHPDEVWGEPDAVLRPLSDPLVYTFTGWTESLIVRQTTGFHTHNLEPTPSMFSDRVVIDGGATRPSTYGGAFPDTRMARIMEPPGAGSGIAIPPTATYENPREDTYPLPAMPTVAVTAASFSWYSYALENPSVDGSFTRYRGQNGVQVRVPDTIKGIHSVPAYQFWDPDAVTDYPPMRQRQRRDGLGMGAPAIRVGGSRQGSTRIRGHH